MKVILSVALLLSYIALAVEGNPTGAPASACDSLSPNPTSHGAEPQTSSVPYSINIDTVFGVNGTTKYYPGRTYNLTFYGNMTFRGFFVQARQYSSDTIRVGVFADTDTANTKLSSCPTTTDGITHSSNSDKNNTMFSWTAPVAGTGTIRFGFAVVYMRTTYWANQRSVVISEAGASPATTDATTGATTTDAATSTTSLSAMSLLLIGILTAMKIIG